MPLPIHIKWYVTSVNLDELNVVRYSRPDVSKSVVSAATGGILVDWEDNCETWHIQWEKVDRKFVSHFEFRVKNKLNDPSKPSIPVARFTDRWFKSRGMEFNLAHRIDTRVNQLLRFVHEKLVIVPNGTLFFVTRAGIREALANNSSWKLIIGYSEVEPQPEFSCTPLYFGIPELKLPKSLEVLMALEPPRLSRYERPWVI